MNSLLVNTESHIFPPVKKLVAIGDIHGDIGALLNCLMLCAKVMTIEDGFPRWIGGNSWVVFCGDLVDRFRPGHYLDQNGKGDSEIPFEEEKIDEELQEIMA